MVHLGHRRSRALHHRGNLTCRPQAERSAASQRWLGLRPFATIRLFIQGKRFDSRLSCISFLLRARSYVSNSHVPSCNLVSVVRSHVMVLSSSFCLLKVGVQCQVPHLIPDNLLTVLFVCSCSRRDTRRPGLLAILNSTPSSRREEVFWFEYLNIELSILFTARVRYDLQTARDVTSSSMLRGRITMIYLYSFTRLTSTAKRRYELILAYAEGKVLLTLPIR